MRSVLAPVTVIVSLAVRRPFTSRALEPIRAKPSTAMAVTRAGVRRSPCQSGASLEPAGRAMAACGESELGSGAMAQGQTRRPAGSLGRA